MLLGKVVDMSFAGQKTKSICQNTITGLKSYLSVCVSLCPNSVTFQNCKDFGNFVITCAQTAQFYIYGPQIYFGMTSYMALFSTPIKLSSFPQ